MKKIYIGKEIIEDINNYLGIVVEIPEIDNLLTVRLFSEVFEKPLDTKNIQDIKANIDEFLFDFSIPLIDYSGYEDKVIVVLDESDKNNINIIGGIEYTSYKYSNIKNFSDSEAIVGEIRKYYKESIIDNVFDMIKSKDFINRICIIDFNFKSVIRIKKDIR